MNVVSDVNNATDDSMIRRNVRNLLHSEAGLEFCASRNIDVSAILAFNLGLETRRISNLRDRLLFPIYDQYGNFVAYQGRAIYPDMQPKYWFQPFEKSKVLYGLHTVLPMILDQRFCAIVEGNIDVITLWMLGVPAVAYMGSMLSESQASILRRYTENVLVVPDNDKTGREMLPPTLELLDQYDFGYDVLKYPEEYKDPSDFYKEDPCQLRTILKTLL